MSLSRPPDNTYSCPLSRAGFNLELVRQAPGAAQTQTQAAAGRIAIPQRQLDVGDTGAVILEGELQAPVGCVVEGFHPHRASSAVVYRIARQLTRRRNQFGLVDQAKTQVDGPIAHSLPHPNDVFRRPDGYYFILRYNHRRSLQPEVAATPAAGSYLSRRSTQCGRRSGTSPTLPA